MKPYLPLFFLIVITITPISSASRLLLFQPQPNTNNNNTSFIKISCGVTLYPQLCYKTLPVYASTIQSSHMEMANAALNISLKSALPTSKTVLKLSKGNGLSHRDAGAIKDCMETVSDSVDELKQSLVGMSDLKGPDFEFKLSNVQTWVSAALKNEDTCMDGFEGNGMNRDPHVKEVIRACIERVAQCTSISLATINIISSN